MNDHGRAGGFSLPRRHPRNSPSTARVSPSAERTSPVHPAAASMVGECQPVRLPEPSRPARSAQRVAPRRVARPPTARPNRPVRSGLEVPGVENDRDRGATTPRGPAEVRPNMAARRPDEARTSRLAALEKTGSATRRGASGSACSIARAWSATAAGRVTSTAVPAPSRRRKSAPSPRRSPPRGSRARATEPEASPWTAARVPTGTEVEAKKGAGLGQTARTPRTSTAHGRGDQRVAPPRRRSVDRRADRLAVASRPLELHRQPEAAVREAVPHDPQTRRRALGQDEVVVTVEVDVDQARPSPGRPNRGSAASTIPRRSDSSARKRTRRSAVPAPGFAPPDPLVEIGHAATYAPCSSAPNSPATGRCPRHHVAPERASSGRSPSDPATKPLGTNRSSAPFPSRSTGIEPHAHRPASASVALSNVPSPRPRKSELPLAWRLKIAPSSGSSPVGRRSPR